MRCPFCKNPDTRVIDTRAADDGLMIRRRRECPECSGRFSTTETATLMIQKRGGSTEEFSRRKVVAGVSKACQGRPVTSDDINKLAQDVEQSLRATGNSQFDTHQVGLAILPHLRELDQIAYLRFASVYQNFQNLEDFERAIIQLRSEDPETQLVQETGAPRKGETR